jgi:hypothetical protein
MFRDGIHMHRHMWYFKEGADEGGTRLRDPLSHRTCVRVEADASRPYWPAPFLNPREGGSEKKSMEPAPRLSVPPPVRADPNVAHGRRTPLEL